MFDLIEEKPIEIKKIIPLPEAQPRLKLNSKIINEYVQDLVIDGWEKFHPITVFTKDDLIYYLADGFHRLEAHNQINAVQIKAQIFVGSEQEAVLYSCGANRTHGLKRTDKDKENAILKLLNHPEWSKWNNKKLAEIVGCSSMTITNVANRHNIHRPDSRLSQNSKGEITTVTRTNAGRKVNLPQQIKKSANTFALKVQKVEDRQSYLETYFDILGKKLGANIRFEWIE